MIFGLFNKSGKRASLVRAAYEKIVAAARQPKFYADWGVPDTVEGRFDMIALHGFLAIDGLADKRFAQEIADELFRDMDRSLREMGAGDVTVPKKVRKMAEVFYGRAAAYRQALESGRDDAIDAALARNVFAESAGDIPAMRDYVKRQHAHLKSADALAFSFLEAA
jgi:cytochrome b pre-mRNA-processing protein 3